MSEMDSIQNNEDLHFPHDRDCVNKDMKSDCQCDNSVSAGKCWECHDVAADARSVGEATLDRFEPPAIEICTDQSLDSWVVRVWKTGHVDIREGVSIDDASRIFWEKMAITLTAMADVQESLERFSQVFEEENNE